MLMVMAAESGTLEADIVTNSVKLTPPRAMALRVACTSFNGTMSSNPDQLGTGEHGRPMASFYLESTAEILSLMLGSHVS